MSHNLSQNAAGEYETFVAGKPAWHGLGVNVEKTVTWRDASKLAKLDWTISKVQMSNPVTSGLIPYYGLIRDDDGRCLNVVKDGYTVVQNQDGFKFCDALIESGKARFVSAGALGNGEVMWCLVGLDGLNFEPVNGDEHKSYLLFVDYRNGKAAQAKLTITRVVCNNTLNIALEDVGEVLKMKHTASITSKMAQAKKLVSSAGNQIDGVASKLRTLASKKVTQPQFTTIMEKLFPGYEKNGRAQNKAAIVATNFMSNDGGLIKGIEGSAYSMLQAITRYIDHQRDGLRVGDGSLDLKRAESAMFGTGDQFKNMAMATICKEVGIDDIDEILANVAMQSN